MNLEGICISVVAAVLMVSCADKNSEGDAARKLSAAPKQIIDKATTDVGQALQQGADRNLAVDEGKN